MKYTAAVKTDAPETLSVQPGQWIDYQGARGRFYGRSRGTVWIAWGKAATHRFSTFANVAKEQLA